MIFMCSFLYFENLSSIAALRTEIENIFSPLDCGLIDFRRLPINYRTIRVYMRNLTRKKKKRIYKRNTFLNNLLSIIIMLYIHWEIYDVDIYIVLFTR